MIIIKKLINVLPILMILFLSNCSSQEKVKYGVKKTQNKCNTLFNKDEIKIETFYNETVKQTYLDFIDSKNEIDIILIKSYYGYNTKQGVKRFFKNQTKILFSTNEKEKKITQKESNPLILSLAKIKMRNIQINCPVVSSSQSIYELIIKKDGILYFSLYSNKDISKISKNLSVEENNFIIEFIDLSGDTKYFN